MAAMRMKHGLEYEKIESTLCYLNELFFIYSTKTKHFLSNVFSFISLWHPMQSDFEEIEFCNQKYWRFYLRERERKSNQTIALYEFVNLSSVVGIEKVPMFQFCEFGLNP